MRIGVVAPSTPIDRDVEARVTALAAERFGDVELNFHPQCFETHNHFAGPDEVRAQAFIDMANDPTIDALWFARGGYGACRIAEIALPMLGSAARAKTYLGYSDAGFLLAGLYREGIGEVAHGPMPADIRRKGGEPAVERALAWLLGGDPAGQEPSVAPGVSHAAFNITVLSHLLGTPLEPDLGGHVLMLEEVSEYTYRTDRAMFHITSSPAIQRVAGIRLGRCSLVPENDRPFGMSEEEIVRHWCAMNAIDYLGAADIGHDAANRIVPFGHSLSRARP